MTTKAYYYAIEAAGWARTTHIVYAENDDVAFEAAFNHAKANDADLYGPYSSEAEMGEALYCIANDC